MRSEFLCETENVSLKKNSTNVRLNFSPFLGSKLTEKEPFSESKPFLLILWSITPPRTSRCPVSCSLIGCRLLLMYFQSELISHSRILNCRQVQIFSMPNISRVHGRRRFSQIASDNSHCMIVTCVNEHRFASDCGHLSAIFAKSVGE